MVVDQLLEFERLDTNRLLRPYVTLPDASRPDEALFGDHPQALPPEGDAAGLESLDFNQVRTVFRKAFAPSNLVFAVIGPEEHADLKQALETRLSGRGTPGPGLPAAPVTTVPAVETATLGGEMAAVRLGSIFEVAEEDRAALSLLTAVISDRMGMDLRETRGWAYSLGISANVGETLAEVRATMGTRPPLAEQAEAAMREWIDTGRMDVSDERRAELARSLSENPVVLRSTRRVAAALIRFILDGTFENGGRYDLREMGV